MGQKTGIEWTESTWNPIRGCSRVSEGCRNCYAETVANRFKGQGEPYEGLIAKGGQWNGAISFINQKLYEPLNWTRPRMIFVNSMSDLFHPNVPEFVIDLIFAVMALAPHHIFQILTKRPERMREYLTNHNTAERIGWKEHQIFEEYGSLPAGVYHGPTHRRLPLPNVWLGVSVEDQNTANTRIPPLLQTPAAIRWISAEPLLGPIELDGIEFENDSGRLECWDALALHGCKTGCTATLDWVVVGGESGTYARPMHPNWPASIRAQCHAAGIPFLFKQWGEWAPETVCATERGAKTALFIEQDGSTRPAAFGTSGGAVTVQRNGKKNTGRNLYGCIWDQYPGATA